MYYYWLCLFCFQFSKSWRIQCNFLLLLIWHFIFFFKLLKIDLFCFVSFIVGQRKPFGTSYGKSFIGIYFCHQLYDYSFYTLVSNVRSYFNPSWTFELWTHFANDECHRNFNFDFLCLNSCIFGYIHFFKPLPTKIFKLLCQL